MSKKANGELHRAKAAEIVIVGAGASGCMAAVSAAREGRSVLLLDSNDKICRKVYATGNGRCNLTNLHMTMDCYHTGGGASLSAFFARFNEKDLMHFWESQGVFLHDRQGYVYPRTDQAATIAEGFEKILRALPVTIELGKRVVLVRRSERKGASHFQIETSDGSSYMAETVILAGGGMAGPQYGCGEEIYRIASSMGHAVIRPLPALVPLLSDDRNLKASAGVRCDAKITLLLNDKSACSERGELQMTEQGISGIPVFQLSAAAVRALEQGAEAVARIDFIPDLDEKAWEKEMERRLLADQNCMLSVYFLGLVNRKILDLVLKRRGMQAEMKASRLSKEALRGIMEDLRAFRIRIVGAGTFKQAQVTSGGVPLAEMDENLQSVRMPGLFMAGELVDVDGICGGYNLQWAMTSGWIAGKGAAKVAQESIRSQQTTEKATRKSIRSQQTVGADL